VSVSASMLMCVSVIVSMGVSVGVFQQCEFECECVCEAHSRLTCRICRISSSVFCAIDNRLLSLWILMLTFFLSGCAIA
jgi:hypothetical protein